MEGQMEYQSADISEIAKAMAAAQGEFPAAGKNAVNPHLKNRYADLAAVWEAVREVLPKHGLSIVQGPRPAESGRAAVYTMLMHTSGQWIASLTDMPVTKNDCQGYGSAYTYARRYSLSAMLGVVSEDDDDGEGAKRKPAAPTYQPYDLHAIEAKMANLQHLDAMTDYLRSLAIPPQHPQRPAITAMYQACQGKMQEASHA